MKTILTLTAGGLFGASLLFSPLSQAVQQNLQNLQNSQDPSDLCKQQTNESESTQDRLAAPYFEEDLLPEEPDSAHGEISIPQDEAGEADEPQVETVYEGPEYGEL